MAAAAKLGADQGCIIARQRPDGDLYLTVAGFPKGGGDLHPGNAAGEAGDIFHIVLIDTDLFFYRKGQGAHRHLTVLIQPQILDDPALHLQTSQRVGVEHILVDGVQITARRGAGRRHRKTVGGGIGIAETAGIRGHRRIQSLCQGLIQGHTHVHENIIDNLTAGTRIPIHQFKGGKRGGGAMVVDAQGYLIL